MVVMDANKQPGKKLTNRNKIDNHFCVPVLIANNLWHTKKRPPTNNNRKLKLIYAYALFSKLQGWSPLLSFTGLALKLWYLTVVQTIFSILVNTKYFSSKTNFTNHLILKSSNQLMVYIIKSHDKSTFKLVCWLRLCGIMKILMHNSHFPLIPYFECYFLYLILYHYMIFEWK